MQFLGANVGAKPTGQTAYARWHSIRADKESLVESGEIFESVAYRDIFPGIDLVWRAGPEGLKSEYLVHAGSEPSIIRFQYDGETPRVESGTLVIGDSRSQLREHEPYVYQEIGGVRVQVKAGYRILESGVVTFEIGEFDRSQPLTIDPDFDFSTVWGGSMFDSITSVAIGPDGSVYACGWTESSDLPVRNAYQPAISHPLDAFVMKMTPSNALVYATFLGGSGQDRANAIAVDSTGSAYVTGTTGSPDFPISANAAQKKLKGYSNGFVVKLSADGSKLLYSTYLGGSGTDVATAIQLDATSIYIAGSTSSDDFPIRNGFQTGRAGLSDGFILRLDASTGSISYGSYLGGSADDQILAMCVSNGKIYMTGSTKSADFPVLRPFQANLKGGQNAFVTVLDESSSSLVYSTFLGGSSGTLPEQANGIAVDSIGRAFIAGITPSLDFPVPPGWQPNLAGASDGFVVRLSADGSTIDAGTYFGGSDFDNATALALDAEQHVYVVGYTSSWDFPVTQGSSTPAGTFNLFVSRFSPALDRLEFSTLWGGSGPDSALSVAASSTRLVVVGQTLSWNSTLIAPLQTVNGNNYGGFILSMSVASERPSMIGVYRAGSWYLDSDGDGHWDSGDLFCPLFGSPSDIPVTGDWDGSGKTKIGVYHQGIWYLDYNGDGQWDAGDRVYYFGLPTDIPVTGDWDGSGKTKIGIYHQGVWYLDYNGDGQWDAGDRVYYFGLPTDIPITGDWDGSGRTKIGVFHQGVWYLDYNGDGQWDAGDVVYPAFGLPTDVPVTGDWDGSGKTKIGVYHQGIWYLDYNGDGQWDAGDLTYYFGLSTDVPVVRIRP